MENLHYRIIINLACPKNEIPRNNLKVYVAGKIPNFASKMLKCVENIALQSLQILYVIVLRVEIASTFDSTTRR